MSLLSICQSVTGEVGWPQPATIVGNTEPTAVQLFSIANNELRALSEMLEWPQLEVEYRFVTVAGTAIYLFPSDFRYLCEGAVFNADQFYAERGSMGVTRWQMFKYGKLGNLTRQGFRVVFPLGVPGIELSPPPTGLTTLVAVYMNKTYAVSTQGVGQPQYTADGDVSRIPERMVELGVKWRFRRAKGLDYSAEYAEYDASVKVQLSKARSSAVITIGGRRPLIDGALTSGYVPETGFGQ